MKKLSFGDLSAFASGYGLLSIPTDIQPVVDELVKGAIALLVAVISRWIFNGFGKKHKPQTDGKEETQK